MTDRMSPATERAVHHLGLLPALLALADPLVLANLDFAGIVRLPSIFAGLDPCSSRGVAAQNPRGFRSVSIYPQLENARIAPWNAP